MVVVDSETRRIEEKHLTEFHKVGHYTTVSVNGKPVTSPAARETPGNRREGDRDVRVHADGRAPSHDHHGAGVLIDDPVYYIAYTPVNDPPGPDLRRAHRGVPGDSRQDRRDTGRRTLRDSTAVTRRQAVRLAAGWPSS